jgi:hypothetical protein
VLLVTDERWGRPVRRAFLIQLTAAAFLGWIAWSEAAAEPDPADLVSMLDHAAIVEPMALAREATRPDLAVPFR